MRVEHRINTSHVPIAALALLQRFLCPPIGNDKPILSLYYLGCVGTISLQSTFVEDANGMPNLAEPFCQPLKIVDIVFRCGIWCAWAPEHPPTPLRCLGAPNTGRTHIRGCLEIFAASVDNNYSATWRKRRQIMAVQESNESLQNFKEYPISSLEISRTSI